MEPALLSQSHGKLVIEPVLLLPQSQGPFVVAKSRSFCCRKVKVRWS